MTQLWMVKVDKFDNMIDPVEYYGPILSKNLVQWRGFNNNEFIGPDVPELQWPDHCRFRDITWLIVGTRPFRPMPRGLRFYLSASPRAIGSIPAGIINHEFLIVDESAGVADPSAAVYVGTDVGSVYECRMFIRTLVDFHDTSSQIGNYDADDFLMHSLLLYVGPDDRWSLFSAPDDWNLADILPIEEVPTLAFSKSQFHPDGNGRQIIWQADPDVEISCPLDQQLPFTWDWPFGGTSQFVEITPQPATRCRYKVIDPIAGPPEGLSRIVFEWAEFGESGRVTTQVDFNGIIDRHFITVFIAEAGGVTEIDAGFAVQPFDIDIVMRQLGPLIRVDVFNEGDLKGTHVFVGILHQCQTRFRDFTSNYDVPHIQKAILSTTL